MGTIFKISRLGEMIFKMRRNRPKPAAKITTPLPSARLMTKLQRSLVRRRFNHFVNKKPRRSTMTTTKLRVRRCRHQRLRRSRGMAVTLVPTSQVHQPHLLVRRKRTMTTLAVTRRCRIMTTPDSRLQSPTTPTTGPCRHLHINQTSVRHQDSNKKVGQGEMSDYLADFVTTT